ncbi:putative retrotransposon hot spot (RHS) protein [Trypanosoma cruzi]|uniref:Putative retrotransposon hot spot (RHS) protein n=1 Tax=Trypanosoma cruzi TaxID=5693 RepID=A0A2V2UYW5_TRYCR|nr:putative retrotransposon hot spot (RHS) protein [Trypanosoma cruzi]
MVLTSDKAWPYTWAGSEHICDCCVNCEVDRVWQIVKRDLTEWFSLTVDRVFAYEACVDWDARDREVDVPARTFSISCCTTMPRNSQWLRTLLRNQYTCLTRLKNLVSELRNEDAFVGLLQYLTRRGVKGHIIYDVAKQGREPHPGLPFTLWGMIVVTPPDKNNFQGWMDQNKAMGIAMNCPDESDVRALCVWMKHNEPREQGEYWKQVKERMDEVGPILRVIFDTQSFNNRKKDIGEAINVVDSSNAKHYVGVMSDELWEAVNASQLVQIVRLRRDLPTETYLNSPASHVIANKIYIHLSTKMHFMEIFKLLMHPDVILLSIFLEMSGTVTFMCRGAVNIIIGKLKELKPPEGRAFQPAALQRNPQGHPTELLDYRQSKVPLEKNFARYGVMYKPAVGNFPLVDAFFFMESPRKTLVGLQMTTAHDHHTKTSTVKQFTEYLSWFFTNWEEFAQGLSWEIIYVQHADSKPMENCQRCDVVNPNNETDAEKKIVAFWDKRYASTSLC